MKKKLQEGRKIAKAPSNVISNVIDKTMKRKNTMK